MKGLVIHRAKASNTVDLFPLVRQAAKEGAYPGPSPTESALKQYYFKLLTVELPNELHFFYLARRGRGHLGFLHAIAVPGQWDGKIDSMYVNMVWSKPTKRKMGVGKKLLDQLIEDAENLGIKKFEFLSKDDLVDYWVKKRSAKKVSNLMRAAL